MDYRKLVQRLYTTDYHLATRWEDPTYVYSLRHPAGFYQRWQIQLAAIALLNEAGVFLHTCERILDIGCGNGWWLRFLAEVRGSALGMVGIDLVHDHLVGAHLVNPGIFFLQGDAAVLPFQDECFDLVLEAVTWMHFTDPALAKRASQEVIRVLRKGGHFLWYDALLPPAWRGHGVGP